ncbi:MAG: sulfurtransferase [Gammaproteobacteria bacterium]|nr:sulfurtransferase [Gammaproteobacteria bacterium]
MPEPLISVDQLLKNLVGTVVVDCRFSLADTDAGESSYRKGHIPGAHYLHLDRDLCGEKGEHGGRHPLPDPARFCERLAQLGITTDTPVVAYDDSRFAFASRLWWMLRSLGYRSVQVLDGGFSAWCAAGAGTDVEIPEPQPVAAHQAEAYAARLDIDGVRSAQSEAAILVDSREEKRYRGIEEPIDPVAGHIPGAVNYPWQGVSDEAGFALDVSAQSDRWQDLDPQRELVVYCGSGVTACVNLLSLAMAGRSRVQLYAGSWSDWCSYLETIPGPGRRGPAAQSIQP